MVDLLADEALKVPATVWKQTFAGLLAYDDMTELMLIEAPTLLVWGDGDGLVSREMQVELAGAIPDAALLVYADAGHTPRWDDPARFSDDLASFARGAQD
jgi:rifampin ADP-ribosylating transferase